MRIPLRTKVTLALVAFGLIPAGIVAAFAYKSAEDFMGKQKVMIRQAAVAISDHASCWFRKNYELDHERRTRRPAENPPPIKWELTEEDLQDLQQHISDTVRDYNLTNATVYLVDPRNLLIMQRSKENSFVNNLRDTKIPYKYEKMADHGLMAMRDRGDRRQAGPVRAGRDRRVCARRSDKSRGRARHRTDTSPWSPFPVSSPTRRSTTTSTGCWPSLRPRSC